MVGRLVEEHGVAGNRVNVVVGLTVGDFLDRQANVNNFPENRIVELVDSTERESVVVVGGVQKVVTLTL